MFYELEYITTINSFPFNFLLQKSINLNLFMNLVTTIDQPAREQLLGPSTHRSFFILSPTFHGWILLSDHSTKQNHPTDENIRIFKLIAIALAIRKKVERLDRANHGLPSPHHNHKRGNMPVRTSR